MDVKIKLLTVSALLCVSSNCIAQWGNGANNDVLLNLPAPDGVIIGTTSQPPPSALTIFGNEMGTSTNNLFETHGNALVGDLHWRFYRGASLQLGRIFSLDQEENWNIDAHKGDLRLWTRGTRKAILNSDYAGLFVNGIIGQDLSGMFGVGDYSLLPVGHPFTKLHIDRFGTTEIGFRDGQREGLGISAHEDYMYCGLFEDPAIPDQYDANIIWSRETGIGGAPSFLKFLYTGTDGTSTQSSHINGLEVGRFQIDNDLNELEEGYFGIGDFTTASEIPEERLDILTRTIRIREFKAASLVDWQDNSLYRVLVADDDDGRVYWRDASTIGTGGGGGDLDWEVIGNDVISGHGTGGFPPNAVGVGNISPRCKLDVLLQTNPAGYQPIAICGYNSNEEDALNTGVSGVAIYNNCGDPSPFSPQTNVGGSFQGLNAEYNFGVQGVATTNPTCSLSKQNIGVFGDANGASANWAGYFNGRVYSTAGFITSDQAFKTNVLDLNGALGLLDQLEPKTFDFLVNDYPDMQLPNGQQYGFLAQDVASVMPEITTNFRSIAKYDSLGNVVSPSVEYMAVNYTALIPLLVQSIKDQQEQIDALQAIVLDCCSVIDSHAPGSNGSGRDENGVKIDANELHQNVPNPFKINTQIDYNLVADGSVELIITDINGVQIEMLVNEPQSAGYHSLEWKTEDLAPGIYFYSLIVDGQLWVKKAVKIQ